MQRKRKVGKIKIKFWPPMTVENLSDLQKEAFSPVKICLGRGGGALWKDGNDDDDDDDSVEYDVGGSGEDGAKEHFPLHFKRHFLATFGAKFFTFFFSIFRVLFFTFSSGFGGSFHDNWNHSTDGKNPNISSRKKREEEKECLCESERERERERENGDASKFERVKERERWKSRLLERILHCFKKRERKSLCQADVISCECVGM